MTRGSIGPLALPFRPPSVPFMPACELVAEALLYKLVGSGLPPPAVLLLGAALTGSGRPRSTCAQR